MHSVTISIFFLAQILVLQAQKAPPRLPEEFNGTLAYSYVFPDKLKDLYIEVYAKFNSSASPDLYPAMASGNDTNLTTYDIVLERYFSKEKGYLYTVESDKCTEKPIDQISLSELVQIPSFLTSAIVIGYNKGDPKKVELVKSYAKCPFDNDGGSCDQWRYYDNGLMMKHFGNVSFNLYADYFPIAFTIDLKPQTKVLIQFTFYIMGKQKMYKFLPYHLDKCTQPYIRV